jgi:predicted TIM-barrel fold metal-dependent hydrolase
MRIIDLEAHFYTQEYVKYLRRRKKVPREESYKGSMRLWYTTDIWEPHGPEIDDRLCDLAENRLKDMDKAGIDMQVLSLSAPGCEQFPSNVGTALTKRINNALSKATKEYPDRFIGLAALALQNPGEAANELERSVIELGLKGAKVHSHVGNTYLDDKRYWIVFEKAEKLDVPIYLHPTAPNPSMMKAYMGYGFALGGPAWGFGAETALQVMRLIYSGVFDKYPRLKIILGHLGEGLVFWINRIDFVFTKPWIDKKTQPKIKRLPSEYLRDNFAITTSGIFNTPAFLSAFMEMGAEYIMFSSDYPYENTEDSVRFINNVSVAQSDRETICHSNAEKLFKLTKH